MENNRTRAKKPTDRNTDSNQTEKSPVADIDIAEFEKRKHENTGPRMDRVSFRLSPALLNVVDTAVERGEYPSRSKALRTAVRQQFPQPDGGHSPGHTPRVAAAGDSHLTADSAPASAGQSPQWRLHYRVGELAHYTAWTADFATVENLAQQYRRSDYGQEITIERRAEG